MKKILFGLMFVALTSCATNNKPTQQYKNIEGVWKCETTCLTIKTDSLILEDDIEGNEYAYKRINNGTLLMKGEIDNECDTMHIVFISPKCIEIRYNNEKEIYKFYKVN